MNFEVFCFVVTGYSNTKESFPSCMFVVMASGKYEPHTYFTFLQRIITYTHMKNLIIFFCIIYVVMSNIHFSVLDNVKMTSITHKFSSKLLFGKDMFILTFVVLENETSISIWDLEKINVLK